MLLAPYVEVAENHEPAELPLEVRELALAGVRNSDPETLHLDDHIRQYEYLADADAGRRVRARRAARAAAGRPRTQR